MMAPDRMHSSGWEKHQDLVQKDILYHIQRNTLAGESNFIAFSILLFFFLLVVHTKLSFHDSNRNNSNFCLNAMKDE